MNDAGKDKFGLILDGSDLALFAVEKLLELRSDGK